MDQITLKALAYPIRARACAVFSGKNSNRPATSDNVKEQSIVR